MDRDFPRYHRLLSFFYDEPYCWVTPVIIEQIVALISFLQFLSSFFFFLFFTFILFLSFLFSFLFSSYTKLINLHLEATDHQHPLSLVLPRPSRVLVFIRIQHHLHMTQHMQPMVRIFQA